MSDTIPEADPLVKLQTAQASVLMSTSLGLSRRGKNHGNNPVALSMAIQALIQVASQNGMKGSEIYTGLGLALGFALGPMPKAARIITLRQIGTTALDEADAGDAPREEPGRG